MISDISYLPTDEQTEFRAVLHRFLEDKSPPAAVRSSLSSADGYDHDIWEQLAHGLGLPSLAVPQEYGGAGFGYAELAIAAEETGAALLCSPYFATVALATNALLCSDDEPAKSELLSRICEGSRATLIAPRTRCLDRFDTSTLVAHRNAAGWILEGSAQFVIDGATAELLLVVAAADAGTSLFCVEGTAAGVRRTPMRTLDLTRRQARLDFDGAPARLIGTAGAAEPGMTRALDLAAIALAAEQVGGAQHCLDQAVEHAKTREQFGQPIGAFQAIKFKCADLYLAIENARMAVTHAARVADAGAVALVAPLAKATCSEAFTLAATESIHIHGGIGFTWEHEAHLYFRRAKASEALLGTPAAHRELLVSRLGL